MLSEPSGQPEICYLKQTGKNVLQRHEGFQLMSGGSQSSLRYLFMQRKKTPKAKLWNNLTKSVSIYIVVVFFFTKITYEESKVVH